MEFQNNALFHQIVNQTCVEVSNIENQIVTNSFYVKDSTKSKNLKNSPAKLLSKWGPMKRTQAATAMYFSNVAVFLLIVYSSVCVDNWSQLII